MTAFTSSLLTLSGYRLVFDMEHEVSLSVSVENSSTVLRVVRLNQNSKAVVQN